VKQFSKITAPMTTLLKGKSNLIIFIQECDECFLALTQAPVLAIIDTSKGYLVLCMDASDLAIGAILMQVKHIIAYKSCKLNSMELNYLVHEKELLAVIHALKVWRHYLLGVKFKIETDHQTLKYLSTQPNLSRRQSRWVELMQQYDFDIEYIKGKENVVANALSRRPMSNAISYIKSCLIDEIKMHYISDELMMLSNILLKVYLRNLEPPKR